MEQEFDLNQLDMNDAETRSWVGQNIDFNDPDTKAWYEGIVSPPKQGPKKYGEDFVFKGDRTPFEGLGNDYESQYAALMQRAVTDPSVSEKDFNALASQFAPNNPGFGGTMDKYLAEVRSGKTQPSYEPVYGEGWDEYLAQRDRSAGDRFYDAMRQGVLEGFGDTVARAFDDWTNIQRSALEAANPGQTDEWYTENTNRLRNEAERALRDEIAVRQQNDSMFDPAAFIGGMLGSVGPEMLLPGGSGVLARIGLAGAGNAAADSVYQNRDIANEQQDEFSLERLALNTALGTALQGTLEVPGAISRALSPDVPVKPQVAPSQVEMVIPPVMTKKGKETVKSQKRTESVQEIASFVDNVRSDWDNAPETVVRENFRDLDGVDDDAVGVFDAESGKVLVNVEALRKEADYRGISPEEMTKTLMFHEGLGHYGLTQKFREGLDESLDEMYRKSKWFQKQVDTWMENNPDAYVDDPSGRHVRAADEVLAEISEKRGQLPSSLINNLKNKIKDFARQIGLNLEFSQREIETILAQAHSAVVNGKGADVRGNGYRSMKVYHGSGADFDQFDHSKMGTGEGAQVYGWGTYLTDTKKIAEGYRRVIGGESVSWNGVEVPWYQVHDNMTAALKQRFPNSPGANGAISAEVFDSYREGKPVKTFEEILKKREADGLRPLPPIKNAQEIIDYINDNLKVNQRGKLYEVDVPDDAKWLEWDKPVSEQPLALEMLEDAGLKVDDYADYNYVEHKYGEARLKYRDINERIARADEQGNEALADELFPQLQQAAIDMQKWKKEYDDLDIHEGMSGEGVYKALTRKLGSPKAASEFLDKAGFTGNKYLDGMSRKKGEGSYNYVVFDDQTPKITAKYMKSTFGKSEGSLQGVERKGQKAKSRSTRVIEDELSVAARDTQSFEEWISKAGDIKMSQKIAENLSKGAEAPEVLAARKLVVQLSNSIADLKHKVADGTATEREQYLFTRAVEKNERIKEAIADIVNNAAHILNSQKIEVASDDVLKDNVLRKMMASKDRHLLETPEGREKFARKLVRNEKKAKLLKLPLEVLRESLALSRALISTYDFSGPFRQGFPLIGNKRFWQNYPKMYKMAFSQKAYDASMDEIMSRPSYKLMKKAGLRFTELGDDLSKREEQFTSRLAPYIPGVKLSERAYSGFLNRLSADFFDDMVRGARRNGIDIDKDTDLLKEMASLANASVGRGNLGSLEAAARPLATALFSPRLIASRLKLLNPLTYTTSDPVVRKAALKNLFSVATLATGVLTAAKMAGADVETDPRSSDFLKIKIGNTRYDILGGFGQYIVLGNRLRTGEVKTSKGAVRKLGEGYKADTKWDIVQKFFTNKASPAASFVVDYLRGSNAIGEEFNLSETDPLKNPVMNRFIPLVFQDMKELVDEKGFVKGVAMGSPAIFGVGIQNYDSWERSNQKFGQDPESEISPVTQELRRLSEGQDRDVVQGPPSSFRQDGEKFELTDEQKEEWGEYMGTLLQEYVADDMSTQEYADASDEQKREIVKKARSDAYLDTKAYFLDKYWPEDDEEWETEE